MTKTNRRILAAALILAVLLSTMFTVWGAAIPLDRVAGLQMMDEGRTLVAMYEGDSIALLQLDQRGVIRARADIPRERDGKLISLSAVGVDPEGVIFLLEDLSDALTGKYESQALELVDPGRPLRKRIARHDLPSAARYRWMSVSETVILMGTERDEVGLVREAYEPGAFYGRTLPAPKNTRLYPLKADEGIYQAVIAGQDIAYTTKSGKVFTVAESDTAPREVYPARDLTRVMYPLFLAPQSGESVYIGEQESGDLLSLSLADGGTQVLKTGTEPFSGGSSYAPTDVRCISMQGPQDFAALAANGTGFDLLRSAAGTAAVIPAMRLSVWGLALLAAKWFAVWGVGLLALFQLIHGFFFLLGQGRTILVKLLLSTLPLLAAALTLFGVFACRTYGKSVEQSFQKQVEDEGNLLMALFGTESFDEIEYPYDYNNEAYAYLRQQMATRTIYATTAYYEREQLFVGVDGDYPCFYPFDIRLNGAASELYLRAAYTGKAVTGILDDRNGRRIACVTPIGGVSGGTVYLLETGILLSNLEDYTQSYLWGYVAVSLLFLLTITFLLIILFSKILSPIGQIRKGLEEFALGDRSVRLETTATDEFSGIVRVFNKMAGDIDAQIYRLKKDNETYFRFIPPRMLQTLGKDNLGDVQLGTGSSRMCWVLCADLELDAATLLPEQEQDMTNRFFNIVNKAADRCGATLMADSVSMRRLRAICPGSARDAVEIALAALAEVDTANSGLPIQSRMKPLFLAHRTNVYYGVCGDENRLVPALLSTELDALAGAAERLRQFGSRLLVTKAALEGLSGEDYSHRFIGYLDGMRREAFGLYDFYDAASPEVTRLLGSTRAIFDKAMGLLLDGRWQEAKNLFALVLRENQYDDVARYYVFLCEKNL